MIDAERKKDGGFIEYKHMLTRRASLMDCLDLMQAFWNITSRNHMIYARGSMDEIIRLDNVEHPIYEYICLASCNVFSICGWSIDEHCMFIMTLELDKHRVFLYSEFDIDSDKLFALIVHNASVIGEKRKLLLSVVKRDEKLLNEARWYGIDFSTARVALGYSNDGYSLPELG